MSNNGIENQAFSSGTGQQPMTIQPNWQIRVTTNELLEMRPNFLHIMHQDTWNLVVGPALDGYGALSLDGAHIALLLDLLSRRRDHVSRNVVHEIFNEFFVTD